MLEIDIDMNVQDEDNIEMDVQDRDLIDLELGNVYGTKDHSQLVNRDIEDQHPIDAITGLTAAISGLQDDINNLVPALAELSKLTRAIPFGSVDADSTATAFTVTVPGITELKDGVICLVKNGVITSAAGCTLDVNGLGAKPIYSSMAAATTVTTVFNANYTALFIYDETRVTGGCWVFYYGYYTSTNSIGYQLRTNTMRLPVSSTCYRYRLLFTRDNGYELMPANNSTSTNATSARTPCNEIFDPFGPIYYYGYTTALSAGGKPGAAYYWQQYIVTLGYSFTPIVLTESKPVYVVATPTTNGMAILDSSTPVTQTLPTSNDGKIYIFMGVATSTTAFELMDKHPVYYHDGSMLQHYKG